MANKRSLPIGILLLFVSCMLTNCGKSTKQRFEAPVFKMQEKAQYCAMPDSTSFIETYPKDLAVYDRYLVVLAWNDEYWVHFYDRENGRYLGGCVKQGRGPGEVIVPDQLDVYDGKIGLLDSQTKRYSTFLVSTQDDHVTMELESFIRLDTCPYTSLRAYRINKNKHLVDGQLPLETDKPRQRFHLLQAGKKLYTYTDYPMTHIESIGAYMEGRIALSPDRKRFVCGTLYGATLEIFNSENLQLQDLCLFYEPKVTNERGV